MAKICVLCNEDCSDRPRIKNPEGQYACKACVEARQKSKSDRSAPIQPEPIDNEAFDLEPVGEPESDGVMDVLLADVPEATPAAAQGRACPACGAAMAADAIVCVSCGYNTATDTAVRTKSKNIRKEGGVADAAASVATGTLHGLVPPLIGGGIAGAIGAGAWAAIAFYWGWEVGIVAWIVGGLVGAGAFIATQGQGGTLSGVVAAILAVASIAGGKFWAVSLYFDKHIAAEFAIDDASIQQMLTDDLAMEWEAEGRDLDWKDGTDFWASEYPDQYPQELLDAGAEAFAQLTPAELQEIKDQMELGSSITEAVVKTGGFLGMWSFFDLIFVPLGLVTAFRVGAGEFES
ncbi:MAG: hypothetical protein AAGI53_11055 [Planctomycetota bacterium]